MKSFLGSWLVSALVLLGVSYVVPGFNVQGFVPALFVALGLGLFNGVAKPILWLLTLPLNFLTLGLFTFVINALGLWLIAVLVPGFTISGFGAALVAALLIAVANTTVGLLGAKSFA